MDSSAIANGTTLANEGIFLPKAIRIVNPWNLFVHLAFNGKGEDAVFGASIQVSNRLLGATDKDVADAYKRVKENPVLWKKLNEKMDIIKKSKAPLDSVKRKEAAKKWKKDLFSRVRMMARLFECDISILISPQRQEDFYMDIGMTTSDAAHKALMGMGGIQSFTEKLFKLHSNHGMFIEYANTIKDAGRDRVTDHEVNCQRFLWGNFKRTVVGCDTGGNEIVTYQNRKAGVEIVGFDFGVDRQVAVKPDYLGDAVLKDLQYKVNHSFDAPDEQKTIKIVKISSGN
ncbi:hypothetical protein INT45_009872 [Circinella minor]|uniref:Uncharacterized protein n=1 Tax=Circinella minor TaxID=1195481 RepID=A0A8H7RR04_9FUNG|nr:hypothetical protein INT45_009872 [Circinella minor]